MDYDRVSASYARCCASSGFFDTFYDKFLAASDEIPLLFANTDFVKQKEMLEHSIMYMLAYAAGRKYAAEGLARIAELHSRRDRDIDPKFYSLWLDCLCEAIKAHDAEWSLELEKEWRQDIRKGIEFMIARY
jgi:hemoglobin-like flavoprotein